MLYSSELFWNIKNSKNGLVLKDQIFVQIEILMAKPVWYFTTKYVQQQLNTAKIIL